MFVVRLWQLHALGDPHVAPSQIVWVRHGCAPAA